LDKRGDLLKNIFLSVTRSAATGGNVGTTSCFNDFEGYSSIDNVRFYYSNKMFHECYGEELYRKFLQKYTQEQRNAMAAMQFGNKSDAQRVTNAASAYTWTVDLMVPWEKLKKAIPMVAMPNKIRVEVNYKTLDKCMRDSASVTTAITAGKLRCFYTHLLHDNRKIKYNQVHTGAGVGVKTITSEYHLRESLTTTASPTGRVTVRLRNIKNSVVALYNIIRLVSNVDTTATLVS
jgi:hypothetical protein